MSGQVNSGINQNSIAEKKEIFVEKTENEMVRASNIKKNELKLIEPGKHVMFSYNWTDSQESASKVSGEVRDAGFPIWIDTEEMHGNIYEKMAYAVENAAVVLMFLSKNYEKSENCLSEASLAKDLKKRIIPIFTQKGYKPKGMCALIAAGKLYFDFNRGSFEENCKALIKEIGSYERHDITQPQKQATKSNSDILTDTKDAAIEQVVALFQKYRENELQLQGVEVPLDEVPELHPVYYTLSFYQGETPPAEENYQPQNTSNNLQSTPHPTVTFEELLEQTCNSHFIALVGNPGSGKTVCSKRMAKAHQWPSRVCLHKKFMDVNYSTNLTLRELLLDKSYPELDRDTCEKAFQWIKSNDDRCTFIFDGFDQAEWSLNKTPPKESYDTPQRVQDLVSNLCNKHFLPNSCLIFTSRSHAMLSIPASQRPSATYLLGGFSYEDMKRLFFVYTGTRADELWKKLNCGTPQLLSLCYNPLMLQLVATAFLNPSQRIGDITTTTRVFATVMENLHRSDNVRCEDEINSIISKLGRLAYHATNNNTVVINKKQLNREGLDIKDVQDFVIKLHARKGPISNKIFDGDTKLFFSHQTYQEYFSAFFIKVEMSLDYFQIFVKEKLFSSHWEAVRRFLFGILVDLDEDEDEIPGFEISTFETSRESEPVTCEETSSKRRKLHDEELNASSANECHEHQSSDERNYLMNQKQTKSAQMRRILVESLIKNLESFSEKVGNNEGDKGIGQLFSLWEDVYECRDSYITRRAANVFPKVAHLSENPLNEHQVLAMSNVLKRTTKHIKQLSLYGCQLNTTSFRHFTSALLQSKSNVGWLNIVANELDNVDDIIEIIPKVENVLGMQRCVLDSKGERRSASEEERNKLQKALDKLDNSNLQIWVGNDKDGKRIVLRPQKKM